MSVDSMSVDSMSVDSMSSQSPARLGSYLIEAGLITQAQVEVVLNDQNISDMRFGEVLVARGWIKPETIEFVMKYVVEPMRRKELEASINTATHPTATGQSTTDSRATTPRATTPRATTPRATTPRATTPRARTVPIPPPLPPTIPTGRMVAKAKSLDGDFEFEILDDCGATIPLTPTANARLQNDRKPLPSVPDEGGVNWAG